MAHRVEIGEIVENAAGLNITGASVTVKYHGGANAPVYDAEIGGSLVTQPLTTVNGKIGADYPSGAWVAEDTDYDLVVVNGGDSLTFFWPATRGMQLVTTLPAGAGTSAPEDAELAVELYDGTNGGAWLRRYRSAVSAWDMVGGPPPAGGSLPGGPRTRQEFYLTGGTPTIQHMRYNGASWDYVGTPPTVPVTGSPLNVLDVGQSGQSRAGRILALADFTTLCALSTTPVLLANLTTLTSNLGTGGALVNKGTVVNGNGIDGAATAAQFTGSAAQALYTLDTGGADPYRLKTFSLGCWFKTAKRGTSQVAMSKYIDGGTTRWWWMGTSTNTAIFVAAPDGTSTSTNIIGVTDICDDRWHHLVVTVDGTDARLYVDGVMESQVPSGPILAAGAAPFLIGGYSTDATVTAVTLPHYGRIDEAFYTPDILSDDQVRLLYAAKVPHGYATTPTRAHLNVRRKRRGASLAVSDFPAQPKRLHTLTGSGADLGSDNVTLSGSGGVDYVAGAAGQAGGAATWYASGQLFSTDTGLPATTANKSMGIWFKSTQVTAGTIITYGTTKATSDWRIRIGSTGLVVASDGASDTSGPLMISDGLWHLLVAVQDNAAIDGLKQKLYIDARLVGSLTTLTGPTLGGANKFRIGASVAGDEFVVGTMCNAFVTTSLLTQEQISVLFQKSSQALATSPKEEGANIESFDATNVYLVNDQLDSNWAYDLAVAA